MKVPFRFYNTESMGKQLSRMNTSYYIWMFQKFLITESSLSHIISTNRVFIRHDQKILCIPLGDGQVDFDEFVTILGPKLLSNETREGFLGSTIDSIFWQVWKTALLPFPF